MRYDDRMIAIAAYVNASGRNPFEDWFNDLNTTAAIRITTALERLEQGHTASLKSIGAGVFEYRIDTGPGYRIYFGKDGERLVILLGGGTKRRQNQDIEAAQRAWMDYKQRKAAGE